MLSIATVSITFNGCQSQSGRADSKWIEDFDQTDTIELHSDDVTTKVTDSETIARFREIYSNAKWETYWHTLPGNLDEQSIDLYRDGNKLRHFSYTGTLWEMEAYDKIRTARLESADREWIESLFDGQTASSSDLAK